MIYLGTPGRMVGLKCPASQRVAQVAAPTFNTTLEGRIVAELPPAKLVTKRVWDLQTSDATTPEQVAALMQFANGVWGRGPFVFVSADAPFTNLLTPGASTCDPADVTMSSGATLLGSPPLLTPDGWAARSVWKDTGNGAFIGGAVPVLTGQKVTGSAYVSGSGGFVRLIFLNAAGSVVSQHDSSAATLDVQRRSVTVMAPALAVSARVTVTASVTKAANPAITWTDAAQPFGDGQGCEKAVVHGASRSLVMTGSRSTYSNLSYTVTEVG